MPESWLTPVNRRGRAPWLALVTAVVCSLAATVFTQQPAPTRSFRLIVVDSEDAASRVLDQLRRGENFVALAMRVSIDPSAANGGLVGPVPLSDLRPQIRNVLDGLRDGELSPVVRLPTGFGILKRVPDVDPTPAGS